MLDTFWGSHLKNFATHGGVFCAYPKATLEHRQMVVLKVSCLKELKAFAKYLDRGFEEVSWLVDELPLVVPYHEGGSLGWKVLEKGGWVCEK